ncbi:uncharacterized protein YukE [Hamadaea flava]|uniref:WXG100 family type VII secretion target n=1 Tax=Hamadaea flava TaxID=1742688 RepID=A0ABV8LK09_9ACTN|nr:WXG100 family type VII secretion target [Hamadaea flava]MCP2323600.1 uncharacterized protein YukE [Hamadaea flava]
MTINPLIAARVEGPRGAWSGVWLAEDIQLIKQGVDDKSWIDGTLGVVGAGLDALALVSDPAGVLLQYGIAWLIEHVAPLTEALDWLAGDPAQIAAHAQTWRNVAKNVRGTAAALRDATARDVSSWRGPAADAYRGWASEQHGALTALSDASDTMASITEGAGMLVAAVRLLVRDAIAACVSRIVVYAAEELFSLGTATGLVVEQVTTLVASWAGKIARWVRALLASLRRLEPVIRRLGSIIEELRRILQRLRGRGPVLAREGGRVVRNGKRLLMTKDNVREIAARYGIDLRGVGFILDKVRCGPPGEPLYAITREDGKIILTRDAFIDEEQLARTLAHEKFHLDELRQGLPYPKTKPEAKLWEDRAEAFEAAWWETHKHLLGGLG